MKFSMDSVLSRRTLRLLSQREGCGIIKLKGVDRNRGHLFLFYDRFQAVSHHTRPMCPNSLCKSSEVKVVTRGPLFCVVRVTRAS